MAKESLVPRTLTNGAHRSSDGVILDHAFGDEFGKRFQCFFQRIVL